MSAMKTAEVKLGSLTLKGRNKLMVLAAGNFVFCVLCLPVIVTHSFPLLVSVLLVFFTAGSTLFMIIGIW